MLGQSNSSTTNSYIKLINQDLDVTENGIYRCDPGYTGLGIVTVAVSGSGGGDVVYAINNSGKAIVKDQKVWLNIIKLADGTKIYNIVDYSRTTENSLTGVAQENGAIGATLQVLTVNIEEPVVEENQLVTKNGYVLVTKAGDNLCYK